MKANNKRCLIIGVVLILVSKQLNAQHQPFFKSDLLVLEDSITHAEKMVDGLKPANEAHIIWSKKGAGYTTSTVFLYLHGFGASSREGEPIMSLLSKKYNANVYMSRLSEHGISRINAFEGLTEDNYVQTAYEALDIARRLGDEVIIVGTSTGGSLALMLAAQNKDIKGLILYSPFIDLYDSSARVVTSALGSFLFLLKNAGWTQHTNRIGEVARFWSDTYHINGYVSLIHMIDDYMNPNYFKQVTCPVFLGYYYKDEEHQDHTVSVKAMKEMFNSLGTPKNKKQQFAFPLAGNHVIGCDLRSNDWQAVYNRTTEFINQNLIFKQ
nr:alpha/beta hydrolase [uncultured Carboxylicivirga sp.]